MKNSFKEQVGGDHYKNMAIQPAEFILKNDLAFCEGNVIKYICRWRLKGGVEDLKKAKHYVELLIDSQCPVDTQSLTEPPDRRVPRF